MSEQMPLGPVRAVSATRASGAGVPAAGSAPADHRRDQTKRFVRLLRDADRAVTMLSAWRGSPVTGEVVERQVADVPEADCLVLDIPAGSRAQQRHARLLGPDGVLLAETWAVVLGDRLPYRVDLELRTTDVTLGAALAGLFVRRHVISVETGDRIDSDDTVPAVKALVRLDVGGVPVACVRERYFGTVFR